MSGNIVAAIAINGESVTKQPLIKSMRGIKKETLKLISDWISKSNDPEVVCISCIYLLIVVFEVMIEYAFF